MYVKKGTAKPVYIDTRKPKGTKLIKKAAP